MISEVLIIRMLMFSACSAANALAATPEWLRMPTPMAETLATWVSCSTSCAPVLARISSISARVFFRSLRGTVKVMSVTPSRLGFWTIISTRMPCCDSGPKMAAETPGLSGTLRRVTRA